MISIGRAVFVPRGTVFRFSGTEFTAAADSETIATGHRPPSRDIGRTSDNLAVPPRYWGSTEARNPVILINLGGV